MPGADPVHKVTIIPRGRALGVTQQLPTEDRLSMTHEFAQNQIAILMGGRVAEEIVFDQKTTGAGNDIERATELARTMVCEWGMSDELGPLNFSGQAGGLPRPRLRAAASDSQEETAQPIDAEIRRIVDEQYDRATRDPDRAPQASSSRSPRRCSSTRRSTATTSTRCSAAARSRARCAGRQEAPEADARDEDERKRPASILPPLGKKDPSPEPA